MKSQARGLQPPGCDEYAIVSIEQPKANSSKPRKGKKEDVRKGQNGVPIRMHPIHPQWCKNETEHKFTRGVQSFLRKLNWRSEENEEGGITWIELYALYSIHGGSRSEDERRKADPLKKPPMLQAQVAEFKKSVRKIGKFTVSITQEWHLQTSKVMRNRLSKAAINNRQAAIKGMPVMTKEDAQRVMRTLLVLRGIDKVKNMEAWEEGGLEVTPGSIKLQGVAQKWRSKVEQGERWNTDEGRKEDEKPKEDGAEQSCVH